MRLWLVGLIAVIAVLALQAPAYADDRAEAGREFAAGQAADRRKDYRTAIRHYLRANELLPHPNAMFNIATDYEKLGDWKEAAIWYQRYLDEARDAPDRERVLRLIRELQLRVPPDEPSPAPGRLRVVGPIGALVFVDDAPAGAIPAQLELPTGRHTVRVTRDGFEPFEANVEIYPQRQSVVVARLTRSLGAPAEVPAIKTIRAGYLFGVGGGIDLRAQGPMVLVDLGVQALKYDIAARIGKADGLTAVDIVVRATIGKGPLAPYIGGGYSFTVNNSGDDGSTSTSPAGAGYALIGGLRYEVSRTERSMFALIAESGMRFYTSNSGESAVMIPLMASVQVVYK